MYVCTYVCMPPAYVCIIVALIWLKQHTSLVHASLIIDVYMSSAFIDFSCTPAVA